MKIIRCGGNAAKVLQLMWAGLTHNEAISKIEITRFTSSCTMKKQGLLKNVSPSLQGTKLKPALKVCVKPHQVVFRLTDSVGKLLSKYEPEVSKLLLDKKKKAERRQIAACIKTIKPEEAWVIADMIEDLVGENYDAVRLRQPCPQSITVDDILPELPKLPQPEVPLGRPEQPAWSAACLDATPPANMPDYYAFFNQVLPNDEANSSYQAAMATWRKSPEYKAYNEAIAEVNRQRQAWYNGPEYQQYLTDCQVWEESPEMVEFRQLRDQRWKRLSERRRYVNPADIWEFWIIRSLQRVRSACMA